MILRGVFHFLWRCLLDVSEYYGLEGIECEVKWKYVNYRFDVYEVEIV